MAGEGDDLAGPMEELRSAWTRFTQTVSVAWQEAKDTISFGDNQIPREQLVRILHSMAKLAANAYEWENSNDRRRHSVQLRRLSTLDSNLASLAYFVAGHEVSVSEGDMLRIVDPGEGEDTPEQRGAPRADASEDKLVLANVYQRLRQLDLSSQTKTAVQIDAILAYIRENN